MASLVLPRGLGWKKDLPKGPGEKPDLDARPKLGTSPPPARSVLIRDSLWTPPSFDQGMQGSCVAQTAISLLRVSQSRQGYKNPPVYSRSFCYFVARSYDNDTANDSGTYIRNAMMGIVKYGFVLESEWPYVADTSGPKPHFARMPSLSVFRSAFDQRADGSTVYRKIYSRGEERLQDIRRALASGYAVGFGTAVSYKFVNGDLGRGPIAPPASVHDIAGNHAMMLGGYEDFDSFETLNSWGEDFGDRGWCRLSADYIASDLSDDFWIVETAPIHTANALA